MICIDPIIYFFIAGIVLHFLVPTLKIPSLLYTAISSYLLIAIGLKGGIALQQWWCVQIIYQSLLVILLSIICTFAVLFLLKYVLRYSKQDSIVIAAHYGSVSIGTFAVALKVLQNKAIFYEPYLMLFVALMEFPALIIANILLNYSNKSSKQSFKTIVYSTLAHQSLLILLISVIVGGILNSETIEYLHPFFTDFMRPLLAIFLIEMGICVGQEIPEIKKRYKQIIFSSILMSFCCALLGMTFGIVMNLSLGGTVLIMVLASSASYITIPASLKESYPDSNVPLALSYSLGATFPFNVLVGIYLYIWLASLYYN